MLRTEYAWESLFACGMESGERMWGILGWNGWMFGVPSRNRRIWRSGLYRKVNRAMSTPRSAPSLIQLDSPPPYSALLIAHTTGPRNPHTGMPQGKYCRIAIMLLRAGGPSRPELYPGSDPCTAIAWVSPQLLNCTAVVRWPLTY